MSAVLSPVFGAGFQGFSNQGVVLSGGMIYTYLSGTTTPAATWTNSSQSVANPNPIVLNSAGRPPQEVWILNGQSYKFVLTDSNNNVLGTWDNIPGINASNAILSEWVVGVTASYISSTSFTVSGNLVSVYQPNRRIQYTLTGGTYYGSITTSVYNGSSLTTIVFVPDSTGLDSSVTVVNYGFMSASPTSIPQVFASTALSNTWTGATNDFTGSNPLVPTATAGDSSTKAASTAFAMTMTSPGFLGNPTAPTAALGTNTTQLATTAFAQNMQSPAFVGTPTAPTPVTNVNTTQIVTGAWVNTYFAFTVSPTFTGTPLAPTATAGTNTTQIATTAFVTTNFAPTVSPAFTGVPVAPTAAIGTNTNQLATTALLYTSLLAAITSAGAVPAWISSNPVPYVPLNCVVSLIDSQTYRCILGITNSTTDPSLNPTNWVQVGGGINSQSYFIGQA